MGWNYNLLAFLNKFDEVGGQPNNGIFFFATGSIAFVTVG